MGEVKVTFETLFDLARREKSNESLQKLDINFYHDASTYLNDKKALNSKDNPFTENMGPAQIENIKKLIKDIYERREKKILHLALDRVRTGSTIIDTSALLPEEKPYYEQAVKFLQGTRSTVLEPYLNGKIAKKHEETTTQKTTEPELIPVKFLQEVPKFLGVNKEIFGPYDAGQEAEIPNYIATVLLSKGKAEKT